MAVNIWEKIKDYKFSGLTDTEEAQFSLLQKQIDASKESRLCLPSCPRYPNCDCGAHNKRVYEKHGLR